jgi:hypothetical protein
MGFICYLSQIAYYDPGSVVLAGIPRIIGIKSIYTAMLLRILTACLALTLAVASPIIPDLETAGHHPEQGAFNICPQLSVRCVADKDWMHPIGYLGKRRIENLA